MSDANLISQGALVTVGRLADAIVPTYLVARMRYSGAGSADAVWEWSGGGLATPRVWMTLNAADHWAKELTGAKEGGPTVVLHCDRVPPPAGIEPVKYTMPHCRVVRLYELGGHGQVVPVGELVGLDQVVRLVHELYHPMADDRREEATRVDPTPAG